MLAAAPARPSAQQSRIALLTVAIGQFSIQFAMMPVAALLPTLTDVFETEFTIMSWVVGAYLVALTGFILVAGRFGDLYGHRRVYMIGVVIYSVAGGACALAPHIALLIALRTVQGVGGALMLGNGLAIIANHFPGPQRGRAIGVAQMAASAGGLTGLSLATVFLDSLGWRWLFWVLWPIGLVTLWSARRLHESTARQAPARPDLLGAALLFLTLAVGSLSLSHLHDGEGSFQAGWAYHTGFQLAALILLATFVYVERGRRNALIRFRDLRNGSFNALAVCNGIMHMTMMASTFTMPFLLERALGLPKNATGGLLAASQLTWVCFALFSGWLYDRYRAAWLAPVGMALVCGGLLTMGLVAPLGYPYIVATALVLGVGMGLYMTINNTMAISIMRPELRGLGSGVLETTRQLGHSLGVAIAGAILGSAVADSLAGAASAAGFLSGFQHVTWAMAGVSGLGVLLSLYPLLRRGLGTPRTLATPAPMAGGEQ